MKILLLTRSYPPHPEVGALRAFNLSRAFCDAGHVVTVICEAPPGTASSSRSDTCRPARVITLPPGTPLVTRISRVVSAWRRSSGEQRDRADQAPAHSSGRRGLLRNFLLSAL